MDAFSLGELRQKITDDAQLKICENYYFSELMNVLIAEPSMMTLMGISKLLLQSNYKIYFTLASISYSVIPALSLYILELGLMKLAK
jgi:hypothetical protein